MKISSKSMKAVEMPFTLISHKLCPYVQRAVITLTEKGVPFERRDIDLANKPQWFLEMSPLGKTPVLLIGKVPLFESSVIVEYLEDTQPNPLHPADPLNRAQHRAWIEFATAVLNDIAGFYSTPSEEVFAEKTAAMRVKFCRLEDMLTAGPYFEGQRFSLVDAAFGPVFRYFDTFDQISDFGVLTDLHKVANWRNALAKRSSVKNAVSADYPELLERFIEKRGSWLAATIDDMKRSPQPI